MRHQINTPSHGLVTRPQWGRPDLIEPDPPEQPDEPEDG